MPELTTFASRQPATFIRGTVFDHDVTSSSEMLALANLAGWDVRLRPLPSDARYDTETFEVIRTNPFDGGLDRLGVSGERYQTAQNERIFGMFDHLGVVWEAAGAFKKGALVYGQAKTDRKIVIDPAGANDEVRTNVVVSTTHNGSGSLTIGRTNMRLACLNQWNAMFSDLQQSIKIRHTLSMEDRMKKVVLAWKQNNAYFDRVEAEANRLFQIACTDKQFFEIVGQLIGDKPEENKKGALTKWETSRELYSQAWKGETNANVRGTRWGALQAILERNQWARTIQNTANGADNFAMAGIGFDGATETFRQRAHALVSAV